MTLWSTQTFLSLLGTELQFFARPASSLVTIPTELFMNLECEDKAPVPVAARSKASVCDRSLAEKVGSNPTGGVDVCLL